MYFVQARPTGIVQHTMQLYVTHHCIQYNDCSINRNCTIYNLAKHFRNCTIYNAACHWLLRSIQCHLSLYSNVGKGRILSNKSPAASCWHTTSIEHFVFMMTMNIVITINIIWYHNTMVCLLMKLRWTCACGKVYVCSRTSSIN